MIDWNKPVRTMKGHDPIRVLCTDRPGEHPVVGMDSAGNINLYSTDGIPVLPIFGVNEIENYEPEQFVWLNVYSHDGPTCGPYSNRESADDWAGPHRIGRLKVKVEPRFDD